MDPECGVDIYEEPSIDQWIKCAENKAYRNLYIGVPIVIITIILLLWLGTYPVKIGAIVSGGVFILLMLYSAYSAGTSARIEYLRFGKEMAARTSAGMSKADALKDIQREKLKREEIESKRSSANQTAGTQLAGMLAIAKALKK